MHGNIRIGRLFRRCRAKAENHTVVPNMRVTPVELEHILVTLNHPLQIVMLCRETRFQTLMIRQIYRVYH